MKTINNNGNSTHNENKIIEIIESDDYVTTNKKEIVNIYNISYINVGKNFLDNISIVDVSPIHKIFILETEQRDILDTKIIKNKKCPVYDLITTYI